MKIEVEESALESIKRMAQQLQDERDELLAICIDFSKLYGHLWDRSDIKGAGLLPPESVIKYDAIHAKMSDIIAKCTAKPEVLE